MSYHDDEQIIHGVDDLRDAAGEHSIDEDSGCLMYLIVGVILVAGGTVLLLAILGLIAFGGFLVGVFS